MVHSNNYYDPLRPHSHDPNLQPPSDDPAFAFVAPDGAETVVTVADLEALPQTDVSDCYIVSTGHGTSGPFTFGGVRLLDLVQHQLAPDTGWSQVEVISADGFGNRVTAGELLRSNPRPIVLGIAIDGQAMNREQGLVRMIVPSETDDALRQVKWVGRVVARG